MVADGTRRPAGSLSTSAPRPSTGPTGCSSRSHPTPRNLEAIAGDVEEIAAANATVSDAPSCRRGAGARGRARARRCARARAPRDLLRGGRGARPAVRRAGCVFAGASARLRSATTRPVRTTCCRPAAPGASAGRSARDLPAQDQRRRDGSGLGRRTGTTVETIASAEGFRVHGASARARARAPAPRIEATWNARQRSSATRTRPRSSSPSISTAGRSTSPPASASSTTCSSCSGATAGSGWRSSAAGISKRAPTTRSRTSGSRSGRRSTARSATAPESGATATAGADGRGARALCDRRLGAPVVRLGVGAPGGLDRQLRGRADGGVLPCPGDERKAHPAPRSTPTARTLTTSSRPVSRPLRGRSGPLSQSIQTSGACPRRRAP